MKYGLDVVTKDIIEERLGKLPSVIEKTKFTDNGLVEENDKILVPAYVGSQMGFNAAGKMFLNEFYSRLKEVHVFPICPFKACAEFIDFSKLNPKMPVEEYTQFWEKFNSIEGIINYETLMPYAKFMIALFDGGHAADDGVCSEVAYFASARFKPVIGIRTDLRLSENIAAKVNPAVRYFIDLSDYGGKFFDDYDDAINGIQTLAMRIKDDCSK